MARLPYLEAEQVAPDYRDMLKRNTNLHKLLVNSPDMARAFNGVGGYIRFKSTLNPRLRELAILQVGIPVIASSRSARSRPPIPDDRDQYEGAVG